MKITRAVAEGRGDVIVRHNGSAKSLDRCLECARGGGIGENGDIGASLEEPTKVLCRLFGTADGLIGEGSGGLKHAEDPIGIVFTLLNIRLVEGMDAEDMSGHGCGKLPSKEFGSQVISIAQMELEDGMSRIAEFLDLSIESLVLITPETQIDEQAVVPIGGRRENRFLRDGNQACSLLPRTLGKQLFHPQAEGGEGRRCDDGDLVSPGFGKTPHDRTQVGPGIGVNGVPYRASISHVGGSIQQARNVGPKERRRNEAKERQHGIATPNVWRINKEMPESLVACQLLKVGSWIGNGDEVIATGSGALLGNQIPKVGEE